jgi:serine/threonine protein phosphatase 1
VNGINMELHEKHTIEKRRTLVIGDIHGGFKALLQCLERSGFDNEVDTLISLGDIADGCPQVPECVEELLTIKNLIAIRGNHDVWCEDWMKFRGINPNWLSQGGQATYDAYVKNYPELIDKHGEQFFNKQSNYYIDDQNRGFVHGGFKSRKGLGHDTHQSDYYWDRDMWTIAMFQHVTEGNADSDEIAHATRFRNHKEIYIGHTSTGNWDVKPHYPEYKDENQAKNGKITVPMNRCNVWNLDTGGGFGGKLTIMDIDTKEYWQSDPVSELYPNAKGR